MPASRPYFFAIFGASPLALITPQLLGQFIMIVLALRILSRRIGLRRAIVCVLPIILPGWAINNVLYYCSRQWCVVLVFVAMTLFDTAAGAARPRRRYFAGGLVGALAVYLDLFASIFLPGLACMLILSARDGRTDLQLGRQRITAGVYGAVLGFAVVFLLRWIAGVHAPQASLHLENIPNNLRLLWTQCLPFALGIQVLDFKEQLLKPALRTLPKAIYYPQLIAGYGFVVLVLSGIALFLVKRIPWETRRLGLVGAVTALATIAAFSLSVMPFNFWSARYLGPLFWFAPFAMAPLAWRIPARAVPVTIGPILCVVAIGGWLSYGRLADGPLASSRNLAEKELGKFLVARDLRVAAADYWMAYRLTFILQERVIVVPLDASQDRYLPYRNAFLQTPRPALIFHPKQSRVSVETVEADLNRRGEHYDKQRVGEFTILLPKPQT